MYQSNNNQSTKNNKTVNFSKVLGNAILLASIQASIGSVEMSSKFSVINFSKDPDTLQAASNALTGYVIIAFIWMIGAVLISYGQYGILGLITSFIANLIMILWIVISYIGAFSTASKRHDVEYPKMFRL